MGWHTMELERIYGLFKAEPELHNGARGQTHSVLEQFVRKALPWGAGGILVDVTTSPEQWSNALSYQIDAGPLQKLSENDALVIECMVRVRSGKLGVGVAEANGSTFISVERTATASNEPKKLRLWVKQSEKAHQLIFRNVSPDSTATHFELLRMSAQRIKGARNFVASWSSSGATTIPLRELSQLVTWALDVWDRPFPLRPSTQTGRLRIIDVDDLSCQLSNYSPPVMPANADTKTLADWKMETDDAPILECLWRSQSPRRHLEFGTWEGFGARLVASATEADIWTINLPGGETAQDGDTLYDSTDTGEFIGRLYREAGYGGRVHQLLCDSRDFDTRSFSATPFDTVLIDGGHTPDIVESDTDKALSILRKGGMCVWHDFCPDPMALEQNLAPLGVVLAIVENFDRWRAQFDTMYWIRKSWLLVGQGRK